MTWLSLAWQVLYFGMVCTLTFIVTSLLSVNTEVPTMCQSLCVCAQVRNPGPEYHAWVCEPVDT